MADPWIKAYLDHVRFEKRLAQRTCALYELDLTKLAVYAEGLGLTWSGIQSHHIRLWIADMHQQHRSGRGIALILSGWRGFFAWCCREGHLSANPVLGVRAPKAPKPLPKALNVDQAVQLADFKSVNHAALSAGARAEGEWLEARDALVVELLYGSGLRVGELVGLDVQASDAALGWIDVQDSMAFVLGKGSKRRSTPVGQGVLNALKAWLQVRDRYLKADASAPQALLLGRNGTRLTAQAIWQRLRARSASGSTNARASAYAQALFCKSFAPIQWRLEGGARASWACQHQHHAGIYSFGLPAPLKNLRSSASARQTKRSQVGAQQGANLKRFCTEFLMRHQT